MPTAIATDTGCQGEVIYEDHFGNLITSISCDAYPELKTAKIVKSDDTASHFENYQSIPHGKVGLIRGSHGHWEIASNQDSAAKRLNAKIGAKIVLE